MQIKLPALDCLIKDQSTSELHKDIYNIGKEVKGSHFELDTSLPVHINGIKLVPKQNLQALD